MWQPLDDEKSLADYAPAAEVPDQDAVRAAIIVPEMPAGSARGGRPARAAGSRAALDPWGLELPPA